MFQHRLDKIRAHAQIIANTDGGLRTKCVLWKWCGQRVFQRSYICCWVWEDVCLSICRDVVIVITLMIQLLYFISTYRRWNICHLNWKNTSFYKVCIQVQVVNIQMLTMLTLKGKLHVCIPVTGFRTNSSITFTGTMIIYKYLQMMSIRMQQEPRSHDFGLIS